MHLTKTAEKGKNHGKNVQINKPQNVPLNNSTEKGKIRSFTSID
jgi:hypothetical protein